jgi:hypothetical protein
MLLLGRTRSGERGKSTRWRVSKLNLSNPSACSFQWATTHHISSGEMEPRQAGNARPQQTNHKAHSSCSVRSCSRQTPTRRRDRARSGPAPACLVSTQRQAGIDKARFEITGACSDRQTDAPGRYTRLLSSASPAHPRHISCSWRGTDPRAMPNPAVQRLRSMWCGDFAGYVLLSPRELAAAELESNGQK